MAANIFGNKFLQKAGQSGARPSGLEHVLYFIAPHRLCQAFVICFAWLAFACFLACSFSPLAHAFSSEWRALDKRERVVLKLSTEDGTLKSIRRVSQNSLLIELSGNGQGGTLPAPTGAVLFNGLNERTINVSTDAFGFICTKGPNGEVYVDLFNDPIGKRWSATGNRPPSLAPKADKNVISPKNVSSGAAKAPAAQSTPTKQTPKKTNGQNSTGQKAGGQKKPVKQDPPQIIYSSVPDSTSPTKSNTSATSGETSTAPATDPAEGMAYGLKPGSTAKPVLVPAPQVETDAGASSTRQGAFSAATPTPTGSIGLTDSTTPVAPPALGAAPLTQPATTPTLHTTSSVNSTASSTAPIAPPALGGATASGRVTTEPAPVGSGPVVGAEQGTPAQPSGVQSPEGKKPASVEEAEVEMPAHWPPIRVPVVAPPPVVLPPVSSNLLPSGTFAMRMAEGVSWLGTLLSPAQAYAATNYEVIDAPFRFRAKMNFGDETWWKDENRLNVRLRVPAEIVKSLQGGTATNTDTQGASAASGGTASETFPINQETVQASQPSQPSTQGSFPPQGSGATGQTSSTSPASSGGPDSFGPSSTTASTMDTPAQFGPDAGASSGSGISQPVQPPQTASTDVTPSTTSPADSTPTSPFAGTEASGPVAKAPPTETTPPAATQSATATPAEVASSTATPPASDAAPVAPVEEPPVIYTDEQGNPVEPPLDPELTIKELDKLISAHKYTEAYALAMKVLNQHNLSMEQREHFLHRKADALFYRHSEDPVAAYQQITDTTTQAINFNTRSNRNAGAYLRLGYLNLQAKNPYQAAAYFSLLRKQFPNDEGVPLSYFYWGNYQYEQNNFMDARDQYNYVLRQYPDSKYAREAALGLIRTDYQMQNYAEAFAILEYTDKRWPQFYLDYPQVLRMMGDVANQVNELDKSRAAYWLYYNLRPDAEDADSTLAKLGDIYYQQRYQRAAIQVYREAVERFPGKDGGIISLMRLAENGIYDNPSLQGMLNVFKDPNNLEPAEAYRKIIKDYADSPLVPLAQLKLAMWNLGQKDFTGALDLCSAIITKDPNSPLAPKATEVALKTFSTLAAQADIDRRYGRVQEIWRKYPILQTQEEYLDADSRMALAVGQWGAGQMDNALDTLEPFFLGHKIPEYSELALNLALDILVAHDRWSDIETLSHRVDMWELSPRSKDQLDYAVAMSYEKQDKSDLALPLWRRLYSSKQLPPEQQAYAEFYFAKAAERSRDTDAAYHIGQESLQKLKEIAAVNPEQADYEKIKTQLSSLIELAESSGLLPEALGYATEYLNYAEKGSADYLAVRYKMSRIHKARGDISEWEATLKELAEGYPATVYGRTAASELRSYELNTDAARFTSPM